MSLTKKSAGSSSPIKRYLSFSGSKGQIKLYDKENKEADEKGNVYLEQLELLIVDVKSSISGFNENSSSSITSNLLDPYSVGSEDFIVKTTTNGKYGEFVRGIYKDIKDKVFAIGGKFTTNVFAVANVFGNYELIRLELNGSGLSPWIELNNLLENGEDICGKSVKIGKGKLLTRKSGQTVEVGEAEYKKVIAAIKKDPMYQRPVWFYAPSFNFSDTSDDVLQIAVEHDTLLQEYFDNSVEDAKVDTGAAPVAKEQVAPQPEVAEDDLPF